TRQHAELEWLLAIGGGELDTTFERADGGRADVIVSVAPLRDAGGRVTGHVATVKDVTERRMAEAHRRAREARREAEQEAARLKDDFLALVSHELRTPL